ncbi:helix-turn-helix transcriptional regulator [Leifsonia sp. RAF41]|uniref:helix-turn-helix transcriptional regulator n=1 Tax=Leifsonia sp. RAF41 TaxID=3233056 RepID=UPI003F98B638
MDGAVAPLGDFLRARRAQITPEDVGLPRQSRRRVEGLRRDELARIAGISPEYYLRLEQGRDRQPSEQVLHALSRALRLDGDEWTHLARLALLENEVGRSAATGLSSHAQQNMGRLLQQWTGTPALVTDSNLTIVMSNSLAQALGAGGLNPGVNLPMLVFSDLAQSLSNDWQEVARWCVKALRFRGDPFDKGFQKVVGILSVRSAEFRQMWARHDVGFVNIGRTTHRIEGFGSIELNYQNLAVTGSPGYVLTTFHAETGSRARDVLSHLAATQQA